MANKRKMEITAVDENERILFSSFQNAANYISHFYTQAVNYQKIAFQAGQNHSLVKLHDWMIMRLEEGKMVTAAEILAYLQDKLYIAAGNEQSGESIGATGASSSAGQDMSYPDVQMEIND